MNPPPTPVPTLTDLHPCLDGFRNDFIEGMTQTPKELSPKYFYDDRGARLFDRICDLEEYYPTRTEMGILRDSMEEIARLFGPACRIVEYGSGSSLKTTLLLDGLASPAVYIPIDIAKEHLQDSAVRIATRYPGLEVLPVCADYTSRFDLPPSTASFRRSIIFFPGSTIGNFRPHEATDFMRRMARWCRPGDGMLIGVDLRKDPKVLEAAYNDREGVTAEFNRNILVRAQKELGARLDPEAFTHEAVYCEEQGRIEMRLVSRIDQVVRIDHEVIPLPKGEVIRTEYSHKFSVDGFKALARTAGFQPRRVWTDTAGYFSIHYLTLPESRQTSLATS